MSRSQTVLALDVGEKRIGVARGDTVVRLASPLTTVLVEGNELAAIQKLYKTEQATQLVVGYPRNQSGETTQQTAYVEQFVERLTAVEPLPVVYQDESLTSVLAEAQLKAHRRPYSKEDIDALAAALILQDYLENAII